MKKIRTITSLLFASGMLLTSCGKEAVCNHIDNNSDHICDKCGETLPHVSSVSINEAPETLGYGSTLTLTATVEVVKDALDTVTWSTNDAFVSLTADGNTVSVKAIKAGNATITAKSDFDENVLDSITIEVLDWSVEDLEMMETLLGERLPYFEGDFTWTDAYFTDLGFLSAEGEVGESLTLVADSFKQAGWDVSEFKDDKAIISHVSEISENYILTGAIYLDDGTPIVDIYKEEYNSLTWPKEKIDEMLDFDSENPEVIPSFDAAAYLIKESLEDDADIEIYGFGDIDLDSYFNLLVESGWPYSTSYYDEYGCYVCHSPRESLEVDVYPELNKIEILKFDEPLPLLDSWPGEEIANSAAKRAGKTLNIPICEGDKYCVSPTSAGLFIATVLVYGGNFETYKGTLESSGFTVNYVAEQKYYLATSNDVVIEISVFNDHLELVILLQEN